MMIFLWIIRRDTPPQRAGYIWGIRLGVAIFLLASVEGGLIIVNNAHTVGAPDGGPGLPFVNWSTTAGDLRIAHFFGMHAMQALPLLGFLLDKAGAPARNLVIAVSILWLAVMGGLLMIALQGRPLLSFRPRRDLHESHRMLRRDHELLRCKEIAESFRTVRKNTIQVAEDIPEDKYSFRATPDTMSVGEMLAHLASTPHWAQQCFFVEKKTQRRDGRLRPLDGRARRAGQGADHQGAIVEALKTNGEEFARQLESATDAQLGAVVTAAERQQVGVRDAARRQGTRDASPRAAVPDRAHGRHRPAPDPRPPGADGAAGHAPMTDRRGGS